MGKEIKIIAHRGASAIAKHENTLEAFDIAIKLGADMVEFDIRRTKDNVMVVFHDDNIAGKKLKNITYRELNAIAGKENYRVPKLEEVLERCKGKICLDIELKESGYEECVIDEVRKRYSYNEYSMKSFHIQTVANIKKIDCNIKTGLLVGKERAGIGEHIREYFPQRRLKRLHCEFISPYYKMATSGFLYRMKKNGIEVYPWTVNKEKTIKRFLKKNVSGIITDRPDIAIRLVRKTEN